MKQFFVVFVVSMLALPLAADDPAPKPKVPTIKEIMQEAHRCRTAYILDIRKEIAKDEPNWPVVEEKSKALITMGGYLAKNTPPSGTKESWEKFTTLYSANAVLMTDAAEKKNLPEVKYHANKLTSMCGACHRAHR